MSVSLTIRFLAPMAVRPVWRHEWAACKSIRTRGLVSSKSSADWHVPCVISCIVLRGERLALSDWLVKGCFAVVHVCVRGGEHMPQCKRRWLPLLLCQRLDYVQHHPAPSFPHTLNSPIKGVSLLLLSFQKSSDLWQWISGKSSSTVLMLAKYPRQD